MILFLDVTIKIELSQNLEWITWDYDVTKILIFHTFYKEREHLFMLNVKNLNKLARKKAV